MNYAYPHLSEANPEQNCSTLKNVIKAAVFSCKSSMAGIRSFINKNE